MSDVLIKTGESNVTADVVKGVFFNNDPTAKTLRHRIGQEPFERGQVPKELMEDARFGGPSSAGSATIAGGELRAVINCLREAAVDGSVRADSCTGALWGSATVGDGSSELGATGVRSLRSLPSFIYGESPNPFLSGPADTWF